MENKKYNIIYADPAWDVKRGPGFDDGTKSAQAKFDKFKQEELEFLKLLNSVDNNKIGELIDQRITLFSTIPPRIDELSSKEGTE
jgi:hypothetical protein